MKLKAFNFATASLFNFATTSAIIAIIVLAVLVNINRVQSHVEESMMETDVANMRWQLRELWAHRTATAQSISGSEIENANPLRLLNEAPKNYRGEFAEAPPDAESIWYFDVKTKRLVYVFSDGRQLRYRLASTAGLKRASLGAIGGMDLVLE